MCVLEQSLSMYVVQFVSHVIIAYLLRPSKEKYCVCMYQYKFCTAWHIVSPLGHVYELRVPHFSAQESVECNEAYESHYKTPFKIHHAEYPHPEDHTPPQPAIQSESLVTAQVKTEQLDSCTSPSTIMSSPAATTRQSSPLSVASSHDGSSYSEVGECKSVLINALLCKYINGLPLVTRELFVY